MTLEESIKHCEDVVDYDCFTDDQRKCSDEHRQLADWLRELKERREKEVTGDLISRQQALSTIEANQGTLNKWKAMKILEELPSASLDLSEEDMRLIKKLRSFHNGSYAVVLDKLITSACNKTKQQATVSSDCISRKDAIDAVNAYLGLSAVSRTIQNMTSIQEILENLPSASIDLSTFSDKLWKIAYERGKAEGRKKGKWIDKSDDIYGAWNYCSVCGEQAIDLYGFCPNCGSQMNGGDSE